MVHLPEQPPVAFSIYLNWRYTSSIDLLDGVEDAETHTATDESTKSSRNLRYERLIQGYILGDMLQDDKFCNNMIDSYFELREATKASPSHYCINLAFDKLPDTSKLRLLIAHHLTHSTGGEAFEKAIENLLPEVWKAMATVSVKEREIPLARKTAWARGKCFYHKHKDGEQLCKT